MARKARTARRPLALAALAAALAVGAGGCGYGGFHGIYSLPLPGGADLGDHPYTVTADFADVEELVPHSAVQVNNVAVGRVTSITLPKGSWTAHVTMRVNGDVSLPANATAYLKRSSLLGEEYVSLARPSDHKSTGTLADHANIPVARTSDAVQVEQVLGALSLLLNDGGLKQFNDITVQLNKALHGNEPQIHSFFKRVNKLMKNLNGHRKEIVSAINGLDELSSTLSKQDHKIGHVLDKLPGGLHALDKQRGALVTMLNSLDKLSGVAVQTIHKSKKNAVADLTALAPTLRQLGKAGKNLPDALEVMFTYPFTDQVLNDIKGDYLNAYLQVAAPYPMQIVPPLSPAQSSGGTAATKSKSQSKSQPKAKKQSKSKSKADKPTPLPLPSVAAPSTTAPSTTAPSGKRSAGTGSTDKGSAGTGSTDEGGR